MSILSPSASDFCHAIDIYLPCAYGPDIPPAMRSRVDALRSVGNDVFFSSPPFELDNPIAPRRFALRLGNRSYPHMKLVMQISPDQTTYLFKADTHDSHICPAPTSSEYAAFLKLMDNNQKIAQEIDSRWAAAGIPTFKTYLRQDLLRRQAAAQMEPS